MLCSFRRRPLFSTRLHRSSSGPRTVELGLPPTDGHSGKPTTLYVSEACSDGGVAMPAAAEAMPAWGKCTRDQTCDHPEDPLQGQASASESVLSNIGPFQPQGAPTLDHEAVECHSRKRLDDDGVGQPSQVQHEPCWRAGRRRQRDIAGHLHRAAAGPPRGPQRDVVCAHRSVSVNPLANTSYRWSLFVPGADVQPMEATRFCMQQTPGLEVTHSAAGSR